MVITDPHFSDLSTLGGNHNYSVSGLCSVYGSSRGVFQNIDPLNILGINSGYRISDNIYIIRIIQYFGFDIDRICQYNTIQYPQRFTIT